MTQPIDNRTLGGLTYNHNMVRSAEKLNNGNYQIIFKTGEKLTYPQQKDFVVAEGRTSTTTGESIPFSYYYKEGDTIPRNAQVDTYFEDGVIVDDSRFHITNVMGATFTSSNDAQTKVYLENSSDCTIDLSANNSRLYPDEAIVIDGAKNKVVLDSKDEAEINDYDISGEGIANQEDY